MNLAGEGRAALRGTSISSVARAADDAAPFDGRRQMCQERLQLRPTRRIRCRSRISSGSEEMTWMDVRDAMKQRLAHGDHPDRRRRAERTLADLGQTRRGVAFHLRSHRSQARQRAVRSIVKFVPEGDIDKKTGHMDTAGTISVRPEIYEGIITDTARSLQANGFEHIVFITDNGGPQQQIQQKVAEQLNKQWKTGRAYYVPEYYASWEGADDIFLKKGLTKKGVRDGIHDDPSSTTLMMLTDPATVRWEERVKAGKATIDGVSIAGKQQALSWGRELLEHQASVTR